MKTPLPQSFFVPSAQARSQGVLAPLQASLQDAPAAHVIVQGPLPAHVCSQLDPAVQEDVQPLVCAWQSSFAVLQRSHVSSHGPPN